MNKVYRLVRNRKQGAVQVVAETARAHHGGASGESQVAGASRRRVSALAQAVLLALLGSGGVAYATPINPYTVTSSTDDGTGAIGTLSGAIKQSNTSGSGQTITIDPSVSTISVSGPLPSIAVPVTVTASGKVAITASAAGQSLLTFTAAGNVLNGAGLQLNGGVGTYGSAGATDPVAGGGSGTAGTAGGSAVSMAASATLTNGATLNGGQGGNGGSGGNSGIFPGAPLGGAGGGAGGAGGAGLSGTVFTLTNTGSINGGNGGTGGNGGNGILPGANGNGGNGGAGVTGSGNNGSAFTLTNRGTITGGNGGSSGSSPSGLWSGGGTGGAGVDQAGPGAQITNYGSITGGQGGPLGGGIAFPGSGGVGVRGNGFTLVNAQGGTITGGQAPTGGMGFAAGGSGIAGTGFSVINSGTITGGNGAAGVVASGNGTITNDGTISAGQGNSVPMGSADAIDLSGGGNTLILHAGSIIQGNVVSISADANGGDTLALGGAVNSRFDVSQIGGIEQNAQYQGFNQYQKVDTSTWTLTGKSSTAMAWTIVNGTLLDSNQGGGDPLSKASVTTAAGGTFAIDPGVHTVASYTQQAGGTFATLVANDKSYGQLKVTGTATLPSNAKIYVDVANPGYAFTASTLPSIISAGSLVSDGTFSVSSNSVLFKIGAVKNGNEVDLTLSAGGNGDSTSGGGNSTVLGSVTHQGNHQATGAAQVLDKLIASQPTGSLAKLFVGLTSEQQVSNAVSQTLPLISHGSLMATQAMQGSVTQAVQSRLSSVAAAGTGMSSGDSVYSDRHFWISPFGAWARQDDSAGAAGYKASTGGVVTGLDAELSPASRVGVAFTYARADVDQNGSTAAQSADIDVYQLLGYGSYALAPNTLFSYQAGYGVNHTGSQRSLSFVNGTANASYNSQTASVGMGLERAYALGARASLTPTLRADYTWVRDQGYQESGSAAIAPLLLNVQSRNGEQLVFSLGSKFGYQLNDATSLGANLEVGYDTMSRQAAITAAYAGAPTASFATYGVNPSPWLERAGLNVTHKVNNGLEVSARYDVEHRTGFNNQSVTAKLRWLF